MKWTRVFDRVRAMDRREIGRRLADRARVHGQRLRYTVAHPRWRRRDLAASLESHSAGLRGAIDTLQRREWIGAHHHLLRHFLTRAPRFVFHPSARNRLRERILMRHSDATARATAQAERILAGSYDLLGHEQLTFDRNGRVDWHLDPVSGRRAPLMFWADVPYLDAAIGDHKVIWELNRHQHWLMLGRAYWLTGDDRFKDAFIRQLNGWMRDNPPHRGINWASSLELGLRCICWVSALELFAGGETREEWPWTVDLLLGVDRQLRQVERHLSWFFSPNTHLLGEGLALYVCGCALPELARSARWRGIGREILLSETARQVLPDGAHAERSTHYHRYALDFYLLALATARISGDEIAARQIEPIAGALAEFMRDVSDENGRYPLIGDDDGGELLPIGEYRCGDATVSLGWAATLLNKPDLQVGRSPEAVLWLTACEDTTTDEPPAPRARRSAVYPAAGYFISRHGSSHLIFDAGGHGYLNGGHAHADALGMTLLADGRPLLVDSGTATYVMDPGLRDYLRSSQAHNTITIDGRSQSQSAGPFHWASTADADAGRIVCNPRFDYFEGCIAAYAPLELERRIVSAGDNWWIVADRIRGLGQHEAAVYWHLHPDWTATADGRGGVRLTSDDGARARLAVIGAPVEIIRAGQEGKAGWISPVYGRIVPSTVVRCRTRRKAPFALATVIEATNLEGELNVRSLEVLSADPDEGSFASAADLAGALAITLFASGAHEVRTVIVDDRRGHAVTTDARMLHARVSHAGVLDRICAVDFTLLHFEGAQTVTISSGPMVHDLDVTLGSEGHARITSSRSVRGVSVVTDGRSGSEAQAEPSYVSSGRNHVRNSGLR